MMLFSEVFNKLKDKGVIKEPDRKDKSTSKENVSDGANQSSSSSEIVSPNVTMSEDLQLDLPINVDMDISIPDISFNSGFSEFPSGIVNEVTIQNAITGVLEILDSNEDPQQQPTLNSLGDIDTIEEASSDSDQNDDPDYMPESDDDEQQDEPIPEGNIVSDTEDTIEPLPGQKRCRNESRKHLRNVEKYKMLTPCKCRRKCVETISETRRVKIHSEFWSWDYNKRRNWIFHHVKPYDVKRKRENARGIYERNSSRIYKMPETDGKEVTVCKQFFLHTLGYKSDKIITVTLDSAKPGDLSPPPDKRGKQQPKHKLNDDISIAISNHIDSYNPAVSHYRREHAPHRLYLPSDLTVKEMHADFQSKIDVKISYDTYRKAVSGKNISFARLGEEECESCLHHSIHIKESCDDDQECIICQEYIQHKVRAERARQEYKLDKTKEDVENDIYVTTDMQKIIMLPRMPGVKTAQFTKRLVTFHQTFSPLGEAKKSVGIIWHEGISGRNCEDIASAYVKFLKADAIRDKTNIYIWCDNCTGQNKNWTLYTCMVYIVNQPCGPNTITLKYLEKGHTFMSADSFHAKVESVMRRERQEYDFQDFENVIGKCGNAIRMNYQDFREWQNGMSVGKFTNKPELKKVVEVKFEKGRTDLQWKESYEEATYKTGLFLKKRTEAAAASGQPECLPHERRTARGIPQVKKDEIVKKLCPLMPKNRMKFWQDIPATNVADLIYQEQLDLITN